MGSNPTLEQGLHSENSVKKSGPSVGARGSSAGESSLPVLNGEVSEEARSRRWPFVSALVEKKACAWCASWALIVAFKFRQ